MHVKVYLLSLDIVALVLTWHREAAVLNLNSIFTPEPSYIWSVWSTGPGALQLQANRPDHLNPLCVGFTCAWQRVGLIKPRDQTGSCSHID